MNLSSILCNPKPNEPATDLSAPAVNSQTQNSRVRQIQLRMPIHTGVVYDYSSDELDSIDETSKKINQFVNRSCAECQCFEHENSRTIFQRAVSFLIQFQVANIFVKEFIHFPNVDLKVQSICGRILEIPFFTSDNFNFWDQKNRYHLENIRQNVFQIFNNEHFTSEHRTRYIKEIDKTFSNLYQRTNIYFDLIHIISQDLGIQFSQLNDYYLSPNYKNADSVLGKRLREGEEGRPPIKLHKGLSFASIQSFMEDGNSRVENSFECQLTNSTIEQIVSLDGRIILCTRRQFIVMGNKDENNLLVDFKFEAPKVLAPTPSMKSITYQYPHMHAFTVNEGDTKNNFLLIDFETNIHLYKLTPTNEIEFILKKTTTETIYYSQLQVINNIPHIFFGTNKGTVLIYTFENHNNQLEILLKKEVKIRNGGVYSFPIALQNINNETFLVSGDKGGFKITNLNTMEVDKNTYSHENSSGIISRLVKANGNYIYYTSIHNEKFSKENDIDLLAVYDSKKNEFLESFIFKDKNILDVLIVSQENEIENTDIQKAFAIVLFSNELVILNLQTRDKRTIKICFDLHPKQILLDNNNIHIIGRSKSLLTFSFKNGIS